MYTFWRECKSCGEEIECEAEEINEISTYNIPDECPHCMFKFSEVDKENMLDGVTEDIIGNLTDMAVDMYKV